MARTYTCTYHGTTYDVYVRTSIRLRTMVRTTGRRRLSDPGVLQGTVTPRRRAQGGDQAYMLADIVVAIPAVDLAVEAVV